MDEKKILVIQTAFLGDAILTLPMIQKLKEKFPAYLIDVICIPSSKDIFLNSPYVNKIIIYDKKGKDKSFKNFFGLIKNIRADRYDRIFSPHRSLRTSIIIFFSGVNETFGFDNSSFSIVYKHRIKYKKEIHEVARNLELIWGDKFLNNWKIQPLLKTSREIEEKLDKIIPVSNLNIIAIAPGSVWNTKIYPKEYYEIIINDLISRGYFVVLIGGKDDIEICDSINKKFDKHIISLAGKINPYETILFLKRAVLLVCNDSAPTHMGMAACIPVLTIYCSTVPSFGFYPYNENSSYISYSELKCKPCGIHGKRKCPINSFDCAYKLYPELVLEKINELLIKEKNKT